MGEGLHVLRLSRQAENVRSANGIATQLDSLIQDEVSVAARASGNPDALLAEQMRWHE
jgi:hypothetical protein